MPTEDAAPEDGALRLATELRRASLDLAAVSAMRPEVESRRTSVMSMATWRRSSLKWGEEREYAAATVHLYALANWNQRGAFLLLSHDLSFQRTLIALH